MKRGLILLLITMLAALLIGCGGQVAKDNTPVDYPTLFQRAADSDGAASETVASELAAAYDGDAEGLLSAMEQCSVEELEPVVMLLVYGKSYGDLDAFQKDIQKRLPQDSAVLDAVLKAIDRYTATDSTGTQNSAIPDDPSQFDKEIIRNFVTSHDYSSGADEEFFAMVANVYRQEPDTLAEIVEGLDDSQKDYIARGVAYDIINHGNYTPGADLDTSNSFISMVEAAIADKSNGKLESFQN